MWPPFLFFWKKDVQIKYAYTAQQILNPLTARLVSHNQRTLRSQNDWVEKLRVRDLSVVLIFLCSVEALTYFFSNNSSGNKTFNFVVRLISRWKQPWIWTYNKHSLRVCPVCHIRLDLQNRKWPQNGSIQGFTLRLLLVRLWTSNNKSSITKRSKDKLLIFMQQYSCHPGKCRARIRTES